MQAEHSVSQKQNIRQTLVQVGKKIYRQGLIAGSDGNISVRLSGTQILITASGVLLGELKIADLVTVNLLTGKREGRKKPSSELPMHLEIYRQRPEIRAVIHAHPPVATAFTLTGRSLPHPVLPELILTSGEIPVVPYATPATNEGAKVISKLVQHHDLLLLDHHGALSLGKDLRTALLRMEKLEHAAWTLFLAGQMGKLIPLSGNILRKLEKVRQTYTP
jgi:L-fuculose-phosphate aldolase